MTPEPSHRNAAQLELWNGRGGEIWTRLQPRLDWLFAPLTEALLAAAAVKPGESVVEIGCGCGDLTLAAAKACRAGGQVLALDISVPMLERAQSREQECRANTSDMAPIQWLRADAMLHQFEPQADLVISRFGVMFFADPVEAFRNIKRALKPRGRLAILCWAALEENPWIHVPLRAVHTLIEPSPPAPAGTPGPFSFSDPALVLKNLGEAGFSQVEAQLIEAEVVLGRAADSENEAQSAVEDAQILVLESGPVAALLRDASDDLHLKVRSEISKGLLPLYDPVQRHIALNAKCWLFQDLPP
jgi:SAM-dependent methyltransferase